MNSTDDDAVPGEVESVELAQERRDVLFAGDTGTLPEPTRRILVQLLLGPSVDARRHNKLWPVLLRDETVLRARLHDLFLELVVDRDQQVAFTRQVASNEVDAPILLRKASLTFIESALLLFLRQRLTQADAQNERSVLSVGEMLEHLAVFEPTGNNDHAKFERQAQNAVEKCKKLGLLQKLRGSDDRYEVSPTLKLLFPAEEIQALTDVYKHLVAHPRDLDDSPRSADDAAGEGDEL
jgi:hypothetical protein